MKRIIPIFFVFSCSFFTLSAQQPFLQPSPPDLFSHLYWQAKGTHTNESFGASGLDTIGFVNDTVPHALSIGADGGASYVLNRKPIDTSRPDTARIYKFPGTNVIRCDLNGDGKPDFVVYNNSAQAVTVLLGSDMLNKFDTAMVLNEGRFHLLNEEGKIIVGDLDSSGYDGILILDEYVDSIHGTSDSARALWYKGGPVFDTNAVQIWQGHASFNQYLAIGHPRDKSKLYVCETRTYGKNITLYGVGDTVKVFLYPLGPSFAFIPQDSIVCTIDTLRYNSLFTGFNMFDVDGDGVDDILLSGYDEDYSPDLQVDRTVFVYKGGKNISPYPTYYFHRPFQTNSAAFGTKIVDVGDVTGHGYHSVLITDPEAYGNAVGAVFLYNMGKALKDSCVATASGFDISHGGFDNSFGLQVAAPGDLNGNGKASIIIGAQESDDPIGAGWCFVFSGDTSYGPVGVHEPLIVPQYFTLNQNYPNPVSTTTDIAFAITDAKLYGAELTLDIYDMLGKKLLTAYQGKADNYEYAIRVDAT